MRLKANSLEMHSFYLVDITSVMDFKYKKYIWQVDSKTQFIELNWNGVLLDMYRSVVCQEPL